MQRRSSWDSAEVAVLVVVALLVLSWVYPLLVGVLWALDGPDEARRAVVSADDGRVCAARAPVEDKHEAKRFVRCVDVTEVAGDDVFRVGDCVVLTLPPESDRVLRVEAVPCVPRTAR